MTLPSYVIITPARNEAQFIGLTIESVVAQTVRPLKWVIVSDGSTDGTDEIVKEYAAEHKWIELVRLPERQERHFAGKVYAFQAGKAVVDSLSYEFVVSLDADISFDRDYFSFLIEKLVADPQLGVAGTPYIENQRRVYDYRFVSIEHVSGACQVFRRACYEAIGGYTPVKVGAIDCIAVISARMHGWKTRTFTEKVCHHHRKMGTAQSGPLKAMFNLGVMDYVMGNHPLWECFRILHQMTQRPWVVRGFALGAGYMRAVIKRKERPVSNELLSFYRREQMQRLRKALSGRTWRDSTKLEVSTPATGREPEASCR